MLGYLGKLIVAKGFKKMPKFQKIARSGHTARDGPIAATCTNLIVSFTGNQMGQICRKQLPKEMAHIMQQKIWSNSWINHLVAKISFIGCGSGGG